LQPRPEGPRRAPRHREGGARRGAPLEGRGARNGRSRTRRPVPRQGELEQGRGRPERELGRVAREARPRVLLVEKPELLVRGGKPLGSPLRMSSLWANSWITTLYPATRACSSAAMATSSYERITGPPSQASPAIGSRVTWTTPASSSYSRSGANCAG